MKSFFKRCLIPAMVVLCVSLLPASVRSDEPAPSDSVEATDEAVAQPAAETASQQATTVVVSSTPEPVKESAVADERPAQSAGVISPENIDDRRRAETEELQKKFSWWPTDAQPAPVQDKERGGYWWWPAKPGKAETKVWGNRGYPFVRKIIFDYQEEELPPPQPMEERPSLLIRKIIKNVKVYFDFDKADIRTDAATILEDAVGVLNRNVKADILITGNCDTRGTEQYNLKLGKQRGLAVKKFMIDQGIPQKRIRIISRGKLDAIAPVTDLVGMQRDRNAQFMIAEVEEVMIPYTGRPPESAQPIDEGKYIEEKEEKVESEVQVSTKEYTVQKNDSLWKIAEKEMGNGNRWKYLYQMNKDRIKNPNKLKAGTRIMIPIE